MVRVVGSHDMKGSMSSGSNFYSVIPASVRYDPQLPDAAKLLYGEIAALANREGYCWASNRFFARRVGVSPRTVRSWISNLQQNGHVRVKVVEANRRQIWLGVAGEPPRKKNSSPQENFFPGVGRNLPHIIKEITTEERNTHRNDRHAAAVCLSVSSAQREEFLSLWSAAYEDFFEVSYKVQNGKDGKAADSLLALNGTTPEQLIELARKAWGRMEGFNCKHAISIAGFASRFNEIRAEVGAICNRSKTKGF